MTIFKNRLGTYTFLYLDVQGDSPSMPLFLINKEFFQIQIFIIFKYICR